MAKIRVTINISEIAILVRRRGAGYFTRLSAVCVLFVRCAIALALRFRHTFASTSSCTGAGHIANNKNHGRGSVDLAVEFRFQITNSAITAFSYASG